MHARTKLRNLRVIIARPGLFVNMIAQVGPTCRRERAPSRRVLDGLLHDVRDFVGDLRNRVDRCVAGDLVDE